MKTIPFDIKLRKDIQSEENKYTGRYKVQTREGESVRIICWDKKNTTFPIVALVEDSSRYYENLRSFRDNGKYCPTTCESSTDLCLVDTFEPKFKIGDKVKYKFTTSTFTIEAVENTGYVLSNGGFAFFKNEDLFELVPEEPELTDLEKELEKCLFRSIAVVSADGMEALAKECAPKILELAKKEIIEKLKEE